MRRYRSASVSTLARGRFLDWGAVALSQGWYVFVRLDYLSRLYGAGTDSHALDLPLGAVSVGGVRPSPGKGSSASLFLQVK